MAKQRKGQTEGKTELTGLERLGLRVSAMIQSPISQLNRSVFIHRLDTDEDKDWEAVMELLAETDGLALEFGDDGNVTVRWENEAEAPPGGVAAEEEERVEEAPF